MGLKENKSLSVALKSTRKEFVVHVENCEKEKEAFRAVIEDLSAYKSQQEQEIRKAKRLEKKLKQKVRKEMSKAEEKAPEKAAVASDHDALEEVIVNTRNDKKEANPTTNVDENQDLEERNNNIFGLMCNG